MKTIKLFATIILLVNLLTLSAYGGSVSLDDAENVAVNLIYSKTGERVSVDDLVSDSLVTGRESHIIRLKPKGWVIVSGDDSIEPVIAWSSESSLGSRNSLPSGFITWMDSTESQIKEAKNTNTDSDAALEEKWKKLIASPDDFISEAEADGTSKSSVTKGPLLISKWGQSGYYNDRCPGNSNGQQTLTGSAATAMAQIINYHKWPEIGTGSYSYTSKTNEFDLSVSFGKITYKWNDISNDDIAKIIYHAGVAVDTDYDYAASSANTDRVSVALREYFRYNSGDFEKKSDQNSTAWQGKIQKSIDKKLPIIYYNNDGYEEKDHFFVLDGYSTGLDGTTCHINWGEEGAADGWYGLDGLRADDSGSSGYAEGAVFGVSAVGAVSADAKIPTAPFGVIASNGENYDHIWVTWSGMSNWGAAYYKLKRDPGGILETNYRPSIYMDKTAKPGIVYYYSVASCNDVYGCSDWTTDEGWCKGSTPTPPTPPKPPTPPTPVPNTPGIWATNGEWDTSVNITWSWVANASSYTLRRDGKEIYTGSSRSYWDYSATLGTKHWYSVRACNKDKKCSGWAYDSGYRKSPAPAPVPKTPGIWATDGKWDTSVNITWSWVANASSYTLRRDGKEIYTGSSRSYWDYSATLGTKHWYSVRACNKDKKCSGWAYDSGYRGILESTAPPPPPTWVFATDGTFMWSVHISWQSVPGATSYSIYRDGTWLTNTRETAYKDYCAAGIRHWYSVKACNDKGCGLMSPSDQGWRGPPPPPTNVDASNDNSSGIWINWRQAPQTAWFYRVFRSYSETGERTDLGWTYDRYFKDDKASYNKNYWYWVSACNNSIKLSSGGRYYSCSEPSNWATGWRPSPPVPATPTTIAASSGSTSGIWVGSYWVKDATYYMIYRSYSATGSKTPVARTSKTSYLDWRATMRKNYWYWVKACNDYGCGGLSDWNTGWRPSPPPPATPGYITASNDLYTSIEVSNYWVSGAKSYEIYRSYSEAGEKTRVTKTSNTTYWDTKATKHKNYWYWVKACNDYGCSGYSEWNTGWRK